MFKIRFDVIEIKESGAIIKHYLHGSRKEVKKEIKQILSDKDRYDYIGVNGLVVWS